MTNIAALSQRMSPVCCDESVWGSGMPPLDVWAINGRKPQDALTFVHESERKPPENQTLALRDARRRGSQGKAVQKKQGKTKASEPRMQ